MEAVKEQSNNSEVQQDVWLSGQLGICYAPSGAVGCGHKMNSKTSIFRLLLFKIDV